MTTTRNALVVVDVQNDFVHADGVGAELRYDVDAAQRAMPQVHEAIAGARDAGVPVVFLRTIHAPWTDSRAWTRRLQGRATTRRLCAKDGWGSAFYEVEPKPDEPVVVKHRYSGFHGTDLEMILRTLEVDRLVFVGFATNVCVESTLRDAYVRDFDVALLSDATAGAFSLEERRASMENVQRFFGEVLTTAGWLDEIRSPADPALR